MEPPTSYAPPIGLKATTLSANSIILTWTDTSLGRNHRVTDDREYTIQYAPSTGSQRSREVSVSATSMLIEELRANTEYEFKVKIVMGDVESFWSMTAVNTTFEESK